MTTPDIEPRIALLIDAENASPLHAAKIMDHCNGIGRLAIARCYGSIAAMKGWEEAMAVHPIAPMMTAPSASKQNASDFALVIDAVALLHRNMFDHAVIVSSDADFTQLALHIRENGKAVSGMGNTQAAAALRNACVRFVALQEPASPPNAKIPPAPTRPTVDIAWLGSIFSDVSCDGVTADIHALARTLAKGRPGYRKGYRTFGTYLKASGMFESANGVVQKKHGRSPPAPRPPSASA